jgi:hypothetical protein
MKKSRFSLPLVLSALVATLALATLAFATLAFATLAFPKAAMAKTDMGNRATPGARMPAGHYSCGLGSYKGRICMVAESEGTWTLTVPNGKGHSVPLKGQLLGTDEAKQLIFLGTLLSPNRLCSADEPADCNAQSVRVILNQMKHGGWRGAMSYWIYRTDDKGQYRHGVTEIFSVRPTK